MNNESQRSLLDFSSTIEDSTIYEENFTKALLTTFDNPFDPFEDDLKWSSYDEQLGYFTSRRIARLIGEPSEFIETGLGKEIEDRLFYSTLLEILRSTPEIPYVLAYPQDFEEGRYLYYTLNVS